MNFKNWQAVIAPQRHRIAASGSSFSYALELTPQKPVIAHGEGGYSRKGQGDSVEDVAAGYGGIIALDLAEENGIPVNERLYISTQLHLPPGTYGTTPPDAKNQERPASERGHGLHLGNDPGHRAFEPEEPDEVSDEVEVDAHSNDWTVVADGEEMEPNRGAVKIAAGTGAVLFRSIAGLHTVTIDGEKEGDDINTGDELDFTFSEPGEFEITCDYHPDMLAYMYVE